MDCETGCGRQAAPNRRKCWACYSANSRYGSPTIRKAPEKGVRHKSPKAMAQEAIEAYNNAVDETDPGREKLAGSRAWARLRTAFRRYFAKTKSAKLNTANKRTNTPR